MKMMSKIFIGVCFFVQREPEVYAMARIPPPKDPIIILLDNQIADFLGAHEKKILSLYESLNETENVNISRPECYEKLQDISAHIREAFDEQDKFLKSINNLLQKYALTVHRESLGLSMFCLKKLLRRTCKYGDHLRRVLQEAEEKQTDEYTGLDALISDYQRRIGYMKHLEDYYVIQLIQKSSKMVKMAATLMKRNEEIEKSNQIRVKIQQICSTCSNDIDQVSVNKVQLANDQLQDIQKSVEEHCVKFLSWELRAFSTAIEKCAIDYATQVARLEQQYQSCFLTKEAAVICK